MNYFDDINKAIEYIEKNLFLELNLDLVSRECNISKYHFLRIFKAVTGYSIHQYIDKRRLSETIQKLYSNDETITNIALDSGYKSPEVFSRKAKAEYGYSPREISQKKIKIEPFNKLEILNRDFINLNNSIVVDYEIKTIKDYFVYGNISELYIDNLNDLTIQELVVDKLDVDCLEENFPFYFVVLDLNPINGYMKVLIGDITDRVDFTSSYKLIDGEYVQFMYMNPPFETTIQTVVDDILNTVVVANLDMNFDGDQVRKIYMKNGELAIDVLQPLTNKLI